jgi:ABC-type Mn2+/Zn2+ transport system ATPase subunit
VTVLTGVRQRYRIRGPWVLDGVDHELPAGVLVRILGGNGSGKSALLKLAAGIGRPTRGRVDGRPVTGYVPERFPPALPLTATEYLLPRPGCSSSTRRGPGSTPRPEPSWTRSSTSGWRSAVRCSSSTPTRPG